MTLSHVSVPLPVYAPAFLAKKKKEIETDSHSYLSVECSVRGRVNLPAPREVVLSSKTCKECQVVTYLPPIYMLQADLNLCYLHFF